MGAWVSAILGAVPVVWALIAAAGAVLALGGRVSRTLDVFSQFAPLYALAGLAAALAALALRPAYRRMALAGAVVAVGASAALIAPEFTRPVGPVAQPSAPGQIKVIQINAYRRNTDVAKVAAWLAAEKPDIVTVSEARRDLRDLLQKRMGWKVAGARGTLMMFTPERYLKMDRPKLPRGSELVFGNATYRHSTGVFELVTTHLAWPTHPVKPGQLRDLRGVVAVRPRDRMILTGDFNSTPWSQELQGLDHDLGLTRRDRALPTWPAKVMGRRWPLPFLPIDHVYAGPGWATVSVERGPYVGSDHYPLVVTLAPVAER